MKRTKICVAIATVGLLCMSAISAGCGSGGIQDSDATLSSLEVLSGVLSPAFDPDVTAYTVEVGLAVPNNIVTPSATGDGANIEVNGDSVPSGSESMPIDLAAGPNPVLIDVEAEDGTVKTYTVVITRATAMAFEALIKAPNADPADFFGTSTSVVVDGDTLVVGSQTEASGDPMDDSDNSAPSTGAVYIYVRTGTTWTQQAYLKASNHDANDNFGISLCLHDDTLVVGAFGESSDPAVGAADNSVGLAGAAYVFVRTGTTWTEQAMLKASDPDGFDFFGATVCVHGDTIAVGAFFEDSSLLGGEADNSAPDAGAAYVFTRTGTTWTQQAFLKATNAEEGDHFGQSVSLEGDTLLVGAPREDGAAGTGEDDNAAEDAGAAYVFVRTGTTWSQQSYLKASNAGADDRFGDATDLSGDTLVVAAQQESSVAGGGEGDDSAADAGAAYIFVRVGTSWTQQAYIKASNAETGDCFSDSVAISGDTLVVGAVGESSVYGGPESDNSVASSGAAYVFTRSGTTWTQQEMLKPMDGDAQEFFGDSVWVSGGTIVVSASGEDSSAAGGVLDNSTLDAGAVSVYR